MKRDRRAPERTCIVTRRKGPPETMLRFVLAPDGAVVPDVARRLPGRGAWVDATRSAVERAGRSGPFQRAFRAPVRIPDDLAGTVDRLLLDDALARLAMANKAGLVVSGFLKVRAALKSERLAVLVAASDGAEDGRAKLERLAAHGAPSDGGPPVLIETFSAAELGRTLGRGRVVHAGLRPGRLAELFCQRAERLQRFREQGDAPSTAAAAGASHEERQTDAFAGTRAI